jgi:DnaK suppressor protein
LISELLLELVGVERFELPTSCSQSRRATRLRYTPRRRILPATYSGVNFMLSSAHHFSIHLVKVTMADTEKKQFVPYVAKKGEEYMNAKQLAHFRKLLEDWKAELSEDIDRTMHTMQDEATLYADPNDRASQESDIALELRNRDRERKLIKKIDETITLMEAGEYGYCNSCGEEIGLKRLEARPTATLCIDCKTLEEVRERQVAK